MYVVENVTFVQVINIFLLKLIEGLTNQKKRIHNNIHVN